MKDTINDKLVEISKELRTQDNRATQHPMFCVQVKDRMVVDDQNYDGVGYFDPNSCESYYEDSDRFSNYEELYSYGNLPEMIRRFCYKDVWRTECVCFTESGCQRHLDLNGHNYRHCHGVRIYVESFHRNPEMIAIREYLLSLTDPE